MHNQNHPDWAGKTYLVIDDFSIVHRMLRDMLRKLGALAIDTVKNGADAIALLREKQYDVVLCDYNFSEGPNGQQILEEARHRELLSLTCIWIMVSSEKAVETVMGAAELAPDGYILKPLTESLLLARLNRAWDRKQAFAAIERAYAARDYRQAAALCDLSLRRAPVHAMDLLRMKAGLLLRAGQPQEARQVYEQAVALREQVWAKAGLARIDSLEGRHAEARKRLLEIVRAHPSFLDAYDQLAQTLQHLGETSQALAVLEQATRLSPNSVMRQKTLGDLAQQLGKFDIAEQAYQTSIAVGEYSILKSPDAYLELARLYGKNGRPQAALELLAAARKNFQGEQIDLRARITESQVYADSGRLEEAQQATQDIQRHLQETGISLGIDSGLEMAQLLSATGGDLQTSVGIIRQAMAPIPPSAVASAASPGKTVPVPQAPVHALHQRAQVLIRYMETNGYNPVSAGEVQALLARAEKLAPRHACAAALLAALEALAADRN